MAKVTMREVAEACGVSKMAVSLALRGHPSVPPETQERIREAAERLGYNLNPYLSRLMAQIRTHPAQRKCLSVAFLNHFPGRFLDAKAEPLKLFYKGAIARAQQRGFVIYEMSRPFGEREQKAQRAKLLNLGVDGVLVFPFEEPLGARQLDWKSYPAVTLGYTYQGNECHRVCCDYFRNAKIVIEALVRHGRKRIGYITSPWVHTRTFGRFTGGILSAAHDPGAPTILKPLWMSEFSAEAILRYVRRERCDALVYFENFPVVEALREKLRIPEDLAVVSCSLTEGEMKQGTAGVYEEAAKVGLRAFDYLEALILSSSKEVQDPANEVLVHGSWRPGRTL